MNAVHAAATRNARDEVALSRNHKHAQAATETVQGTRQACSGEQRLVQRKENACACGGGCPRCVGAQGIQAKFKIGAPNDKYEQEADRVADLVMRMPEPHVQRQSPGTQQDDAWATPLYAPVIPRVQRQETGEEKQLEEQKPEDEQPGDKFVQAKADSRQSPAAGGDAYAKVHSLNGDGQTLPRSTRQFFESRMGHDFSDVRIYSGANAAEAAQSINARAFTFGNKLVFNHGEYAPDSDAGKKLIAHELTHTLQQKRNAGCVVQRQPEDDEDETTRRGRRFASRQPPGAQREDIGRDMARRLGARAIAKAGTLGYGTFRSPDGEITGIRLEQNFRADFLSTANPADYAIVQWIRGEMYRRDAQGRVYYPANVGNALYGRSADQPWLFTDWIVDSPDADPRLSDAMQITVPVMTFQDVPGFESTQVLDSGFVWDVHARVGIYLWGSGVPTTVGDWDIAHPTPLREVEWGWRVALNPDRRGYQLTAR
jgi:hypothetical protein